MGNENSGKNNRNRKTVVWVVLIFAAALLALLLFHFMKPEQEGPAPSAMPSPLGSAIKTPALSGAPASTQPPAATKIPEPSKTAAGQTGWGAKFAGKFTDGQVEKTQNSYRSANISVTVSKTQKGGVTYYIADIYLRDIKYFKTAFAGGKFKAGKAHTYETAKKNDAVIAVNGDNCVDNAGPVVRNGEWIRSKPYKDALVMYNDGSMQAFAASEFDSQAIKKQGAYQVWTFGPMLLKNGQPMTTFDSKVNAANPRTAIGYFEPGHYCFVVVDGRQPGYSSGVTTKQLSQLFYSLGCKAAFNLDGGQSSEMTLNGKLVNQPYHNGRVIGDIVYIADA